MKSGNKKGRSRAEVLNDYEGFVEKFKPRCTTDDCMTPPEVYEALLEWIGRKVMPLDGVQVLRPFWPGADYEAADYPPGAVVIDNPPFSILAKIRRFYNSRGIKYFLFAPALTLASSGPMDNEVLVATCAPITYENGARVSTSFVTNMLPNEIALVLAGDLTKSLELACRLPNKTHKKIYWPGNTTSPALLGIAARHGMCAILSRAEVRNVKKIGRQKYNIFGGGFLLSDNAADIVAAAEKAAAEKAAAERIQLSDEEKEMIEELNRRAGGSYLGELPDINTTPLC
ncbi:MAG: chromosome partitioning protein ParB [Muribaculaceae bacterium]|nr:chromosome partitioning protein ParB [Muribaculaceae bacterium]